MENASAIQTLQAEIVAIAVAFLGAMAALGRWMITFHKKTIEQAIEDARTERQKLETELRNQNSKLETRIEKCEKRWEEYQTKMADIGSLRQEWDALQTRWENRQLNKKTEQ